MTRHDRRGPAASDDPVDPGGERSDAPAALDELLAGLVARRGWGRRLEGARIHECWGEIAGEQLAQHTEPVRLVGGVLVLRADSGLWATEVSYLAGELAARANSVLGGRQVDRVQVVTGRLRGTSGLE